MVQITGRYQHEQNENLDEYFRIVGVPYFPRKLMLVSHPEMIISVNEDSKEWTITTNSLLRSVVIKFKLGEEYEEHMPGAILKSTTTQNDDTLVTVTVRPDGKKTTRTYEFTDTHCIIAMKLEEENVVAKRYFKRT